MSNAVGACYHRLTHARNHPSKQFNDLNPPDEVLLRLNRDLIEQQLSENPFISMVYALFNHQDGTLQFARAGHPPPGGCWTV